MSVGLNAVNANQKIVIFDERGLADGATGRNWGYQVPGKYESENDMKIQASNIQDTRNYIASLSPQWQDKIAITVNGGIDAHGPDYNEDALKMPDLSDTPLNFCEVQSAEGNPNLPAWATGGTETSCTG